MTTRRVWKKCLLRSSSQRSQSSKRLIKAKDRWCRIIAASWRQEERKVGNGGKDKEIWISKLGYFVLLIYVVHWEKKNWGHIKLLMRRLASYKLPWKFLPVRSSSFITNAITSRCYVFVINLPRAEQPSRAVPEKDFYSDIFSWWLACHALWEGARPPRTVPNFHVPRPNVLAHVDPFVMHGTVWNAP